MANTAQSEIAKAKATRSRTTTGRTVAARLRTRRQKVELVDAEMRDRLIKAADAADAGDGIDTTGMSDDEFLALLRS